MPFTEILSVWIGRRRSTEHQRMILWSCPGGIVCFWMWIRQKNGDQFQREEVNSTTHVLRQGSGYGGGVHTHNRRTWKTNAETVYKKENNRLCFLRKLRSFNVCSKMMAMFLITELWGLHCTSMWSVGGAASELRTPTESICHSWQLWSCGGEVTEQTTVHHGWSRPPPAPLTGLL